MIERIALATDFGAGGPYLGQMALMLAACAPGVPVIALSSDLPVHAPELAAYLLPALIQGLPPRTLYLCVVDPGVGSDRDVLEVRLGDDWLLAPDNGLLAPLVSRTCGAVEVRRVSWRPEHLSASFQGRDLFVPLAVRLLRGDPIGGVPLGSTPMVGLDWPLDLPRVVYVDTFGNLIVGLRAAGLVPHARIRVGAHSLQFARTFCEVPPGTAFWYSNAFGLVELAVNQGRATDTLDLRVGARVEVIVGGET